MFQVDLSKACPVIVTGLITFGLAGCWDDSSNSVESAAATVKPSNEARFDVSLEDKPCEIVSSEMVVVAFGVPAEALQQSSYIASNCSYDWEGRDVGLGVMIHVDGVYENSSDAARYFRNATRSMSAAEVEEAMAAIRTQAEESGELDSRQEREAADAVSNEIGSGGLKFVDVENVGDEARFGTLGASLTVRKDNLVFSITAYHGPGMPLPDTLNPDAIMKANKAWMQKTMAQRKEAAVKLARAAVKALP